MNLNKNLLGGIYRKYVRIKGGLAKCVRLRTIGEVGLILANFVRTYYVDDTDLNNDRAPKYLKDLLKLITPPKDVKRWKNANGAPIDERNELQYTIVMGMRYHIRLTLKINSDHHAMMRTSKLLKVQMLMKC